MTVSELYRFFEDRIPVALREEWDNDGLMCCPAPRREMKKVFLCLDMTERMVDEAIAAGADVILSHHPILFRPIGALTEENGVARKLMKLTRTGVSAFSFHTRFDALAGGVNDVLAGLLGLENVSPFGGDEEGRGIGRIGEIGECDLHTFAGRVKKALGCPTVVLCGNRPVHRVAVLGGEGGDFIRAAKAAGADTYVSGRLGYHPVSTAIEDGMNLIEAGHFYTENPALAVFEKMIGEADPSISVLVGNARDFSVI